MIAGLSVDTRLDTLAEELRGAPAGAAARRAVRASRSRPARARGLDRRPGRRGDAAAADRGLRTGGETPAADLDTAGSVARVRSRLVSPVMPPALSAALVASREPAPRQLFQVNAFSGPRVWDEVASIPLGIAPVTEEPSSSAPTGRRTAASGPTTRSATSTTTYALDLVYREAGASDAENGRLRGSPADANRARTLRRGRRPLPRGGRAGPRRRNRGLLRADACAGARHRERALHALVTGRRAAAARSTSATCSTRPAGRSRASAR